MSIITSRQEKDDTNRNDESPIIGKVSIGRPAEEPVLVDYAEGKRTRFDINLPQGRISSGTELREHHIDKLKEAGREEIQVVYGKSPSTLDYFRVLRKSNINAGYVEDPEFYDKFDITPGETLTEIPIMLTNNSINEVLKTKLVNYDRDANLVFCHSNDGYEAERRRTDQNGNYLSSGETFNLECLPFYWDERVKDENNEKTICPYRETGGGGRDCSFTGSLYFHILSEDGGGFQLGRYFKIETTSSTTAQYYVKSLNDIKDHPLLDGQISFVPLKLEIVMEQATRPSEGRYDERKRTNVPRTTISLDEDYLEKYEDAVNDMIKLVKRYRQKGAFVSGTQATDPTEIPEEDMENEAEMHRWNAEFDPQAHEEQLREEGVLEVAEKAEQEVDDNETPVVETTENAVESDENFEKESVKTDKEYELQREQLINKARRMPHDRFKAFVDNIHQLDKQNIDQFDDRMDDLLEDIEEEEKEENYDRNTSYEDENDLIIN